ncbi:relaxin-3 isoform X2 [Phascolarctos cinereus]
MTSQCARPVVGGGTPSASFCGTQTFGPACPGPPRAFPGLALRGAEPPGWQAGKVKAVRPRLLLSGVRRLRLLPFRKGDAFTEELGGESQETTSIEWLSSPLLPLSREPEDFYSSVGGPSWSRMSRSPSESEPEARSGQGFLRGGRDVLAGVSSNCCKWGCSKTEISSLC